MAVHGVKKSHEAAAQADIYAAADPSQRVPKYRIPEGEWDPRHAHELIRDELMLDGNSRQNLATFCQTWDEPEVHLLMDRAIDKNMIDKDEYPQTAEIERRCVHMLADLWNAPDAANTVGASAIGSSEACMLGGMAAKWRWRARRRGRGQADRQAEHGVRRRCRSCGTSSRGTGTSRCARCPMDARPLRDDAEAVLERVDENTIFVVPTLGVTYTGAYEPVAADRRRPRPAAGRDRARRRHPRRRGQRRLPRPVLRARPGVGLPAPAGEVDQHLRATSSGWRRSGVGWVVWRDAAELPDDLIFHVNYLGGDMPVFQINFSRPGGQIVAPVLRLPAPRPRGLPPGPRRTPRTPPSTSPTGSRRSARSDDHARGTDLPRCRGRSEDGANFTLFDLADALRRYGWQVPAYTLPAHLDDMAICRIVVRQGLSMDLSDLLLNDFQEALDRFAKEPERRPSAIEDGGFSHT